MAVAIASANTSPLTGLRRKPSNPAASALSLIHISINAIFEHVGEAGFREREQAALAGLLQGEGQLISTGGGAVLGICLLYTSRCV